MREMSQKRAVIELLFAVILWGFGFIATRWALYYFDAWSVTGLRFAIAGTVSLPIIFLKSRGKMPWNELRSGIRVAAIPGVLLSLTLLFQTWGLNYTTATNSGFITVLYVLFVPVIEVLWGHRKIHPLHWMWVALALVGTALICDLHKLQFNKGDLATLACAITGAGQIVWIGRIAQRLPSPFVFNTFQNLWSAALPTLLAIAIPAPPAAAHSQTLAWTGILYLGLGSSLIAFLIQVRAQRVINASIASLIFLLESPFSALFAFVFLGEKLQYHQWLGAVVIMIAALAAIRTETKALSG